MASIETRHAGEPTADSDTSTFSTAAGWPRRRPEPGKAIAGRSPGYLAWRRLRRNYVALAFLA